MPRRRLTFAVRAVEPRATMNTAWRRLLPGLGMHVPQQPADEVPADPDGGLGSRRRELGLVQRLELLPAGRLIRRVPSSPGPLASRRARVNDLHSRATARGTS